MSDDKFDQAAFKIFRMTHEGELKWVSKPLPRTLAPGSDSLFPVYFETTYQGRKLGLFQERSWPPSREARMAGFAGAEDQWRTAARLVLISENDEIMFVFPPSRQINGLLDAVRYKDANVGEFLDELLKSEPVDVKQ